MRFLLAALFSVISACILDHAASGALFMRGGGTPFVPTNISGMLLWLKADSGAYKDAGITLAASNDTVQQWNDQSGSGNNLSQATGGNRPTYKTSIIGSRPVIRCDGSSSFMVGPGVFPSNQSYTLFIVAVQRGVSSGNLISGTTGHSLYFANSNFLHVYQGSDALTSTTSTGVGVTALHEVSIVDRVSAAMGHTNAVNLTVNGGYNVQNSGPNTDAALQLCAFNSASFNNGDIAEVLLYTKTLTVTERNNVVSYLNTRYGTSVPLYPASPQIAFDGDSITAGSSGTPPFAELVANYLGWHAVDLGSSGITLADLVTQASSYVDTLYQAGAVDVIFAGTNDIVLAGATGAATYSQFQSYCAARHAVGWKVVAVPMLPRGSAANETQRGIFNSSLAADTCANAKVSTSCSVIWDAGKNTDPTYYNADAIHPNTTGHALIATCIEAAVGSL